MRNIILLVIIILILYILILYQISYKIILLILTCLIFGVSYILFSEENNKVGNHEKHKKRKKDDLLDFILNTNTSKETNTNTLIKMGLTLEIFFIYFMLTFLFLIFT